jgi:hypothetical protein
MHGTGELLVKWNKPGSERQRSRFFSYVEDRSKCEYKSYHIYIYIHIHIYIYTQKNTSPKVRLLEQTKGEGKEEMNDRKWIILNYITTM